MFARMNTIQLKPGALPDYLRVLQAEILPILRTQEGFVSSSTICATDQNINMVTVWESVKSLESYHNGAFQKICHLLAEVNDDISRISIHQID